MKATYVNILFKMPIFHLVKNLSFLPLLTGRDMEDFLQIRSLIRTPTNGFYLPPTLKLNN